MNPIEWYGRHPKTFLRGIRLALRAIKGITPPCLLLETTKRCNANCSYCATIDKRGDMEFSFYKKMIDDAKSWAKLVIPERRGEPLLYPYLMEALEYTKAAGLEVLISTNGSLCDYDMARDLLRVGVDKIRFSMDDNQKQGFEANRKGLKFETVLSNLDNLVFLRDSLQSPTKIFVRGTVNENNRDRIQEISKFYKTISDDFIQMPEMDCPTREEIKANPWPEWNPIVCNEPWNCLSINWDESLCFCCNDWYDSYPVGRVNGSGLLKVFNGPRFENIRRRLLTSSRIPLVCYRCRNRGAG